MKQGSYCDSINELTARALWEVENVISCVPDALWAREYCEMPLWKHIYHMLHSLDRWYENPCAYTEPAFHTADLNNLDMKSEKHLSRMQIDQYYGEVRDKIISYNASLCDDELLNFPEGCEYTRFTLILGQYRHLHTHMGMIMGFIVEATGLWPRVLGLTDEKPAGNSASYF